MTTEGKKREREIGSESAALFVRERLAGRLEEEQGSRFLDLAPLSPCRAPFLEGAFAFRIVTRRYPSLNAVCVPTMLKAIRERGLPWGNHGRERMEGSLLLAPAHNARARGNERSQEVDGARRRQQREWTSTLRKHPLIIGNGPSRVERIVTNFCTVTNI